LAQWTGHDCHRHQQPDLHSDELESLINPSQQRTEAIPSLWDGRISLEAQGDCSDSVATELSISMKRNETCS
jgi:hypothetical protein